MNSITEINPRVIRDSDNKETIEVVVKSNNEEAVASVPSGISTGASEAKLCTAEEAVQNIVRISSEVKQEPLSRQEEFDKRLIDLDGTPDKSNLGGNAILALSLSYARLSAKAENLPLYHYIKTISGTKELNAPHLFMNMIEGGAHDPAPKRPAFQEYLVVPQVENVTRSLEMGKTIYARLEELHKTEFLKERSSEGSHLMATEQSEKPLQLIGSLIEKERLNVKLAIDAAANSFFENGTYMYNGNGITGHVLEGVYEHLIKTYDFLSIEDPFQEEEWESFTNITSKIGDKIFIVGDDLITTNPERIGKAVKEKACNAIILKPNQIGTLSEALKAARLAMDNGMKVIVSNRGRETMDDFIADLAWGINAFGLKSGAPYPQERLAKYDRMIAIEAELKS